jgi:hypothetical protein
MAKKQPGRKRLSGYTAQNLEPRLIFTCNTPVGKVADENIQEDHKGHAKSGYKEPKPFSPRLFLSHVGINTLKGLPRTKIDAALGLSTLILLYLIRGVCTYMAKKQPGRKRKALQGVDYHPKGRIS